MHERDLKALAVEAVNAGDCEAALEFIGRIFEVNYLYPDAHVGASICHERIGNEDQAGFHQEVVHGLFSPICPVDAGLDAENPCHVIATWDEYFVLSSLGLLVTKQELLSCRGNPCDRVTTMDPETRDDVEMYFGLR